MQIRPILFNTAMVRAILAGNKSVTRRLIKPQPKNDVVCHCGIWQESKSCTNGLRVFTSPYMVGDILYVRETWSFWPCFDCDNEMCYGRGISYRETDGCFVYKTQKSKVPYEEKWRPSIHMPKEAARIFLRVVGVRVERLQNISNEEIAKEGIQLTPRESECKCAWESQGCRQQPCGNRDAFEEGKYTWKFAQLWDSTVMAEDISDYGFSADPWVWVIEFEQCEKPEGF